MVDRSGSRWSLDISESQSVGIAQGAESRLSREGSGNRDFTRANRIFKTCAEERVPSGNYIYFGLAGDFNPREVEQEVDLRPTDARAKRSRDREKKLPRCSLMRFAQTHAGENKQVLDVYDLAERAIDQLEPHTQQFARAIRKYEAVATLQVVFEFPTSDEFSTPILGFSKRVIEFVAATDASIDMDSYRV